MRNRNNIQTCLAHLGLVCLVLTGCFGETEEKPGKIKNEGSLQELQAAFQAAYQGVSVHQIKKGQAIKYTHNYRLENSEKFQANAEQISEVLETCRIQDQKSKIWYKRLGLLQTGYAIGKDGMPISDKDDPSYKYFTRAQTFYVQFLSASAGSVFATKTPSPSKQNFELHALYQNVNQDVFPNDVGRAEDNESDPIDYKCDGKESKYDSKSTYDCIRFANVSLQNTNSELSSELKANDGCAWFGNCIVPSRQLKYEVILWQNNVVLDRRLYVKTISAQVPPIFIPDDGGQPSLPVLNSCERFIFKSANSNHLVDMCQTLTDIKGPSTEVDTESDFELPACPN